MSEPSIIRRGFRLVAGYVRAHPASFAVAVTGSVIYAAGTVLSTVALGYATNETIIPAFEGGDSNPWAAIVGLMGVAILRTGGVVVRRYYAGLTAAHTKADLQRGMADRILSMPLDRVRSRPHGQLLSHIDADAESAIDAIHPLPFSIGVISMLIFGTISLALLDVPLLLVTLALLPVIAVMSWLNATIIQNPAAIERQANNAVTAAASEIIEGVQVVKTLGREDAETALFAEKVDQLRRARVRLGMRKTAFAVSFSAVPQLTTILILAVGAMRVGDGQLDAGGLVQAVSLFSVLAFPLQVIGFFLFDLPPSVVGHDRVSLVMSEPDDPLLLTAGGSQLPNGPLSARLDSVCVGDDERSRLKSANLEIVGGETLAVVGPTAGGKSTVLEVLARLRPCNDGAVLVEATPVLQIDDTSLRSKLTLATQTASLFHGSVLDNVRFSRQISDEAVVDALLMAGADDLQTELVDGFETVIGERGVTLSGGQRQRVALARALAGTPGMVLLDDATSAVDPALEEQIIKRLSDLPMTVVMVTHRVAAMIAADRVALVAGGRVVEVADHKSLLRNPTYRGLVDAYLASEVLG